MRKGNLIGKLRAMSQQIDDLYLAGRLEEGEELLARAVQEAERIDPAYVLFFQGEQAGYLAKDRARQDELFRQAVVSRPDDHFLIRNVGICLGLQQKMGEADSWLDKALQLNSKDYLTWRAKGATMLELGRLEEAISCFDKVLELEPTDVHSWRNKGVTLSRQGKHSEALSCYDKALQLQPGDFASWREKGVALTNQGLVDMALPCTEKALTLLPRHSELYITAQVNKAYQLYNLQCEEEALALIEGLAKANPHNDYAQRINRHLQILSGRNPDTPSSEPISGEVDPQLDDLKAVVERIQRAEAGKVGTILATMQENTDHITDFLKGTSLLRDDTALFFILRKWNSYTPSIPREDGERSIGGGYFFLVNGIGTVVDPGYNFLENFCRIGGRITDIDNIVVTHAHNDHTADLESLLSLIYRFNSDENAKNRGGAQKKQVRLFLNAGCQKKFSGLLDLRGADYLEDVQTLMHGHDYDMGQGMCLRALPAYHDEVVARKYAVGLHFKMERPGLAPTNIVITSDTGLFPQKDKVADTTGKQIWTLYGLEPGQTDLLIPHLGSIKEKEFRTSWSTAHQEIFYPNHLGLMGTVQVIIKLQPRLAVVSEFGEELKSLQEALILIIQQSVHAFQADKKTDVVAGDLSFIYDLLTQQVYDYRAKGMVESSPLKAERAKEHDFYYCAQNASTVPSGNKFVGEFERARQDKKLFYFR